MCEHYMPTVLAYAGVGEETTCRNESIVEVNWREVQFGTNMASVSRGRMIVALITQLPLACRPALLRSHCCDV